MSLRDRDVHVAWSASGSQWWNFESSVWRAVYSHHYQEVLTPNYSCTQCDIGPIKCNAGLRPWRYPDIELTKPQCRNVYCVVTWWRNYDKWQLKSRNYVHYLTSHLSFTTIKFNLFPFIHTIPYVWICMACKLLKIFYYNSLSFITFCMLYKYSL